jgi:predicted DNA-binding protein (MmcQ/YjbR family)
VWQYRRHGGERRMPRTKKATDPILKELREFGLKYPGAHTKSPWPGHLDLAVNDKTFAYLSLEGEPFGISCKLPQSATAALMFPFAQPTGYGLGKSGWVSASFPEGQEPPVALLKSWIDESYRAQAPKKLVKSLGAPAAPAPLQKAAAKKTAPKKATAVKKQAPAARRAK